MQTQLAFSSALFATAVAFALGGSATAQSTDSLAICNNNGPYVAECLGQSTFVPVTSVGSYNPDGSPVSFQWFEECPWGFFDDPTAADPNYVIDMAGLCQRACVFELRVFSGGQVKKCNSTATVRDTTAPQILGPVDVVDIWGIPTDPSSTGSATAFDACDPSPVVALIGEYVTQNLGPGHEETIVRTWEATDNCGFTAQVTQTIELLSPLVNSSNLEVDVNQCDDMFDRADTSAYFDVVLLGKPGTLVTNLNPNTLRLAKLGDQVNFAMPLNPSLFAPTDMAMRLAHRIGECNPAGTDGLKDLKLRFDRAQVRAALALNPMPTGSVVYLAITGLRSNNTPFIAGAKMTLMN